MVPRRDSVLVVVARRVVRLVRIAATALARKVSAVWAERPVSGPAS